MMSSNEINSSIRAALDAEGDDHYGDVEDIIPAINRAQEWIVSIINMGLGQKKFGTEIFQEIHRSKVIRTSDASRIRLGVVSTDLWTVTGIIVLPSTNSNGSSTPAMPDDFQSYERTDLFYIDGGKACTRLTIEEWTEGKSNPFVSGYDGDQICDELKTYAYLSPISFKTSPGTPELEREITIRPAVSKDLVAVFYVNKPQQITALGNDDIELPGSVQNLLIDKALQYIAFKQGDQTNLFTVTAQDIQSLVQAVL